MDLVLLIDAAIVTFLDVEELRLRSSQNAALVMRTLILGWWPSLHELVLSGSNRLYLKHSLPTHWDAECQTACLKGSCQNAAGSCSLIIATVFRSFFVCLAAWLHFVLALSAQCPEQMDARTSF